MADKMLSPKEINDLPGPVQVHLRILGEQLQRANITGMMLFNFVIENMKVTEADIREGIPDEKFREILIRQRREQVKMLAKQLQL